MNPDTLLSPILSPILTPTPAPTLPCPEPLADGVIYLGAHSGVWLAVAIMGCILLALAIYPYLRSKRESELTD